MATAEAAQDPLAPRYAPDDPSLPQPWKGLIDGSTGFLYYWNPDTNVTQYEKPASLPPPLPPGPPPAASTPKLAPIPVAHSLQPNGAVAQHVQQQGQQVSQLPQQQGQTMTQQQGPMVAQVSDQQGLQQQSSQLGQAMQQHAQFAPQHMRPQMMHPGQSMLSHMGQQMPQQPGQQLSQHQVPQQLGQPAQQQVTQQMTQQHQSSLMAQPQGHQFTHQQLQYMAYQQSMYSQGQQYSQFPNQKDFKAAFPKREETDYQQGNQSGLPLSQYQQTGASSSQNLPTGTNSVKMPQTNTQLGQSQQFSGSSLNMQQPNSGVQMQQTGTDLVHQQHGPGLQNQVGPLMMHSQQPNVPPVGLKMGYEDNLHGRAGNDYLYNANKEAPVMGSQQPKLAVLPMTRNHQESMVPGVPPQNLTPGHAGGFNSVAGHAVHNMYTHAGPPMLNNALMRTPATGYSDIKNLSPVEAYCQQHEVTATGENIPAPLMTFDTTGFPPEILREIHAAGFSSPTPIQAQTWPIALQSRDIVAIAKTGSGKTLGYLIPAFILLRQRRNNPQNGPTVLVLAPTRELATQIQDEAIKFGRSSRVTCTCLYGGAPKGPQLRELERGADIVVATPGRLNDILVMKKIDVGQVSLLVLDEADRMLDMGFEPQIRKIVNEIPPRRQTLMYTATWPKEVKKIASDLLVNPVQVNIGSVDVLAANKAITQYVEVVPQMEKERRLEQILRSQERGSKVIIFCSTKRLCDQLTRSLGRNFGAAAIHGDKSQVERDSVLNQFRSGRSPILVATDVAARGLDIKDIRIVINYDFPTGIEDYVHRIGRTGRAGATGISYTFFSEQDWKYAADLVKLLEGANQRVPPEVRDMALRGAPSFVKDRGGMNRFDSSGSGGGGRWDAGGRGGMRGGGFGGQGGMRDGGFGGHGGMRDGNFGGNGPMRDGGFGGRVGMRDGGFGGYGGRSDYLSGRGNRGRGFGGPGGGHTGWGRNERGPQDRYNNMDSRGRGRGRGRFDNRRDIADRSRGRSYSRSPERVRTWGYSKSRSRSSSRSRSWSGSRGRNRSYSRSPHRSRSRSRSPNRSRSRSPYRSRSPKRNHSRSRSLSKDRFTRPREQKSDERDLTHPGFDAPPESVMSPMSPGTQADAFPATKLEGPLTVVDGKEPVHLELEHFQDTKE
ncbi:DEAD domain-containing protein/Helicase_C domain-containing protein/WW domain-containing protein [Cephalotus follicularis]|uniref:RNA helicase n=1 Tax=Cephalotus follicularis TaxID=3775 RepID=A0A1Q3BV36_CEPFO|nr:DEAD domain-containing protein/Helicase_C domain-containing protein/WW domain-containing protein [Cephalotus follicularis]